MTWTTENLNSPYLNDERWNGRGVETITISDTSDNAHWTHICQFFIELNCFRADTRNADFICSRPWIVVVRDEWCWCRAVNGTRCSQSRSLALSRCCRLARHALSVCARWRGGEGFPPLMFNIAPWIILREWFLNLASISHKPPPKHTYVTDYSKSIITKWLQSESFRNKCKFGKCEWSCLGILLWQGSSAGHVLYKCFKFSWAFKFRIWTSCLVQSV